MNILAISVDLPNAVAEYGLTVATVSPRCLTDEVAWREVVSSVNPAVIVSSVPIPLICRRDWLAAVENPVVVAVSVGPAEVLPWSDDDLKRIVHVHVAIGDDITPSLLKASRVVAASRVASPRLDQASTRGVKPACLIGCGVVNLLTALNLTDQGIAVQIFDRAPDPRLDRPLREYGCTRGGANARMYTATEADQYGGLKVPGREGTVFNIPPVEHGWDVRKENVLNVRDLDWIREYENLPGWLADQYEDDIHSLNRRAEDGWERVFKANPSLAEGTSMQRGIVRVYSDPESVQRAVQRHRHLGDLVTIYSAKELRACAPALGFANEGQLAGGIMVRGFTLDIHRFVAEALNILSSRGVGLYFDSEVSAFHTDREGTIDGIYVGLDVLPVDNLVISPGAYGNNLLAGLGLGGTIAGVLGLWRTLPNLNGQQHSMKVSRTKAIAADANITVGDVNGSASLIVGSGYGFVGMNVDNIDYEKVCVIQRSIDEMMRTLLPDAYEAAGGDRWLKEEPVMCVRPWTATSLGVFDARATTGGQCIVTGGHNTGGFTQAPEVANAVVNSLLGARHPMHQLYALERSRSPYYEPLVEASR